MILCARENCLVARDSRTALWRCSVPLKSETEGVRLVEGREIRSRRILNAGPVRIEFFNERIVQSFVSFDNYRFYAASLATGDSFQRSENARKPRQPLGNGSPDRRFNFCARVLVESRASCGHDKTET